MREVIGLASPFVRLDQDVLGIGAAVIAKKREYGFALGNPLRGGAAAFYDARQIAAQGYGQRLIIHFGKLAFPDFAVHRVHASRHDPHQDLIVLGNREGKGVIFQHLRAAEFVNADGVHVHRLSPAR